MAERKYDFAEIEKKWQKQVERSRPLPHRGLDRQAEVLRPRLLPISQRRGAVGRALPQLHPHGCGLPLSADEGLQRAAPDGLGRVRPARRERGHQEEEPSQEDRARIRRDLQAADGPGRHRLRLVPRDQLLAPRLLQVDPVDIPAALQARAGVSVDGARELVPAVRDGAGKRGSQGRPLLAVRFLS